MAHKRGMKEFGIALRAQIGGGSAPVITAAD